MAGSGGNGATGIVTYSGSRWLNLSATGSEATVVAMPSAATAVNGLQLRLETVAPNGIPEGSMLIAGVMTDAGDVTTFTPCDTVYPVASRRVSILDLRSYSGSGRVIALKYISGSGASSVYVTNLGLAAEQVGEPMASEVTNHSVRLTWSGAQQVKIRVGSDPWVNFTGQPVAGGRWSAVITNLSAGADHNFYIIPASGDSESDCQTVSVTARTMLVAMEVPLCYGFEDYYSNTGLPVGWSEPQPEKIHNIPADTA